MTLKYVLSSDGKSYGVSGYSGVSTSIVIPETFVNLPVTSIEDFAFGNCDCLTSITLPNSLLRIGNWAFSSCTALTGILIPASVQSIGNFAFSSCSVFKSFTIDEANPNFETDGKGLYNKGKTRLLSYAIGLSDSTYDLPNTLVETAPGVFGSSEFITEMTFPTSFENLGNYTFNACSKLVKVTLPVSLKSIGDFAFFSCESLTSITIPNLVTSLGYETFYGCTALASVTLSSSLDSIGDEAFYGCSALTAITLPVSLTSIGIESFTCCSSLTSISLPAYLKSMGIANFYGCTALKSFAVDAKNSTFETDGKGLYLKKKTRLLSYALGAPDSSYVLPDTLVKIDSSAFEDCQNLISVSLPASVTTIGSDAFCGCRALTSFVVASGNVDFETDGKGLYNKGKTELLAFAAGCQDTSCTLPDSLVIIGERAFDHCAALTQITVPSAVSYINYLAFNDCTSLSTFTYVGSKSDWATVSLGRNWNKNCPLLKVITCTDGTVTL